MKVLVCGGAGYIGAHMVRCLLDHNVDVVVFDNLTTGHREAVADVPLQIGDLLDVCALDRAFKGGGFDAVLHFCALSLVGESVRNPYSYYRNNVSGSLNLLNAMRNAGCDKIVFSSTAAVYGNPLSAVIEETHPTDPINPYGASKLMVERMLADAAQAYGLRSVSLRYFNAAGAHFSGALGESHSPETHLVPNILLSALGRGGSLKIFGDNYPTSDGTCVRDYIHVDDLADAHWRALGFMERNEGAHVFNLGSGDGYSVRQIIDTAARVVGRPIAFESAPRRAGDPPILIASNSRARKYLGWEPAYSDIETIIRSAWRWHQVPRF